MEQLKSTNQSHPHGSEIALLEHVYSGLTQRRDLFGAYLLGMVIDHLRIDWEAVSDRADRRSGV